MQLRFTRAEYWILDLAFNARHQLAWLDPEKEIEQMYNRPSHGLDQRELISTLDDLFKAELIECAGPDDTPVSPITRNFLQASLDDPRWTYSLTPRGGAAWESFARPNWDRFVYDAVESETNVGVIECVDRQWLEYYISCLALIEDIPDFKAARFEVIRPWPATYWKSLPAGWRVTVHRPNAYASRTYTSREQHLRDHVLFCGVCHMREGWNRWR